MLNVKLLQHSLLLGVLGFSGASFAQQCGKIESTLNITAPCLNLSGANYSLQMNYAGGTSWSFGSVGTGQSSSSCAALDASLNLTLPCLEYAGNYLTATLRAMPDASKPLGLVWQLASYQATAAPVSGAKSWRSTSYPCIENRTDAFWWDDDKTAWAGCGTGAVGTGLYQSTDGGVTWAQVKGYFDKWRVQGIRRGPDGLLYVSGQDTLSKENVVSVNTSTTPYTVKNVFTSTNNVSLSMQVAHFARDSKGRSFGESLTGNGFIYRASDTAAWEGLDSKWAEDGKSYQILSMTLFNDKIYGAGSTISQPPMVFLPSKKAGAQPYSMTPVTLASFKGEMWGITVLDEKRVVVGGADQEKDVGMIFASKTDPYNASDYSAFDVTARLFPGKMTWIRGVCSRGDTVVAVGEKQPLATGTGIVLLSTDGGQTFANITDSAIKANSVSRCHILSDGTIAVIGASGYVGLYK